MSIYGVGACSSYGVGDWRRTAARRTGKEVFSRIALLVATFTSAEIVPKYFGIMIIGRVIVFDLHIRWRDNRRVGEDGYSRITLLIATFTFDETVPQQFGIMIT